MAPDTSNPYLDPGTGTHYNKLGIVDPERLRQVEYMVSNVRLAELQVQPIRGKFDLAHLQQIHSHVLGDVYEWAGKVRSVNISKRDPVSPDEWKSVFAPAGKISVIAGELSRELEQWNHFKGLDADRFAAAMAVVFTKVNYMHPFAEGNGRATQVFMRQLALEAGYDLNFGRVSAERWNAAAARSMPQQSTRDVEQWRQPDRTQVSTVFRDVLVQARERGDIDPAISR